MKKFKSLKMVEQEDPDMDFEGTPKMTFEELLNQDDSGVLFYHISY